MKMIAKFSKTGDLKYCSHLDLQNLFMRAIARAKIPVQYSQGFNRHPNISMAMALSVGVESVSEYLDVELQEQISEEDFMTSMNKCLPKDVQIQGCRFVDTKFPALMSLVYSASYDITFFECSDIRTKTDEILGKSAIIIKKKTKSKNDMTDIRPLILDLHVKDNVLTCMLRCGQVNLKPRDLISLYGNDLHCKILRTGLFSMEENGRLTEIMDI